jgi:56kDa selenium binding protein (SBP56)
VLYVWTGDYDKQQPDFLAVFEINSTNPNYGKLVKKVNIPTRGNEPHHGQFSYDGYRFGAAGILYPIKATEVAQSQLCFFDTTDTRNPRFANSEKALLAC